MWPRVPWLRQLLEFRRATSMSDPSPPELQPANATARKGGRDRRNEPVEVRNSKTLSYILRHGAAKEHLTLRPDGYVRVPELVRPHACVDSLNFSLIVDTAHFVTGSWRVRNSRSWTYPAFLRL
jgi:hypothetical protein